MTRQYSLLIEGDESGYSAHVPELPAILVTGQSIDELSRGDSTVVGRYASRRVTKRHSTGNRSRVTALAASIHAVEILDD